MSETPNQRMIASWDAAADGVEEWSDEGDFAHRYLITPAVLGLLGDCKGKRVLDGGCGGGYLARLLARKDARMTGIEPAKRLFDICERLERENPLGVSYQQLDLSDLAPPPDLFDIIILNMTLMDIPDYQRAFVACVGALAPGGLLVLSILHPCFDEEAMSAWPERRRVRATSYFDEAERPQTHSPFFHRPLSAYINLVVDSGLTIVRVIEPRLTSATAAAINDRDQHVPTFLAISASKAR